MERSVLLAHTHTKIQKVKAELLCANIMTEFSLCLIWSDFNFQKINLAAENVLEKYKTQRRETNFETPVVIQVQYDRCFNYQKRKD